MKAIILAAGEGKRLGQGYPKCLASVGDRTLIRHQIDALMRYGIGSVSIVVGFRKEAIIEHLAIGDLGLDLNIKFVENPCYDTKNNIYSLWLARHEMSEDFVLLNCDVLFHPKILERILSSKWDNVIGVEYKLCGQEEMKVLLSGHRVTQLNKKLDPAAAAGEYIGLARLGAAGARACREALDELVIEKNLHADYYEEALNRLFDNTEVHAVNVSDLPVIEIDFPEDLNLARSVVYPRFAAYD